jgi:hypothetical protein
VSRACSPRAPRPDSNGRGGISAPGIRCAKRCRGSAWLTPSSAGETEPGVCEADAQRDVCAPVPARCGRKLGKCAHPFQKCDRPSAKCGHASGKCARAADKCDHPSAECGQAIGKCDYAFRKCGHASHQCDRPIQKCDHAGEKCGHPSAKCDRASRPCDRSPGSAGALALPTPPPFAPASGNTSSTARTSAGSSLGCTVHWAEARLALGPPAGALPKSVPSRPPFL